MSKKFFARLGLALVIVVTLVAIAIGVTLWYVCGGYHSIC